MRQLRRRAGPLITAAFAVVTVACGQQVLTQSVLGKSELPPSAMAKGTLKAHLASGDLLLFSPTWSFLDSSRTVTGFALRYDASRELRDSGTVTLGVDSVALFELNKEETAYPAGMQGIAVMAVLGAFVSGACLADPKSCFGSCPTFYVDGDDSTLVQAEGFSSSIARVLEARDIDALARTTARGSTIVVRMRNEALETHAVRRVNLLVAPRSPGRRVFASGDSLFYAATNIVPPSGCTAPEGDCIGTVAFLDSLERTSRADSADLARRETIALEWPSAPARAGIVLGARSSLVSTFLFYQAMAFLGSRAGDVLAAMERGERSDAESMLGMSHELGGIEVQLPDARGRWRTIGTFDEQGPIAGDVKIIPLPSNAAPTAGPLRVRLRAAKGGWRLNWIALAAVGDTVTPTRVLPSGVRRDGERDDRALQFLASGDGHLVTQPGDEYQIVFRLPRTADSLELFLESEGYYYEWMRGEWLAEQSAVMSAMVFLAPRTALRRLAPRYVAREVEMERLFWSSRFARRSVAPAR